MASKTITADSLVNKTPMPWVVEMSEVRFGKLIVDGYVGHNGPMPYVGCKCDCGASFIASAHHIRNGRTSSCGCWRRQVTAKRLTKHGFAPFRGRRKKSYTTWQGMMKRCYNKQTRSYKNYGERGISVCLRWHDFRNFLSDMGEPQKGMTIERKNVAKGYTPKNCIWIPAANQAKNRTYNWKIFADGELLTAREAAIRLGLHKQTLLSRLEKHPQFQKGKVIPIQALTIKRFSRIK